MRILIVSQSKAFRRALTEGLTQRCSQIITTDSTTSMLDALRAVTFDVLIFDGALGLVRESTVRAIQRNIQFVLVANKGEDEDMGWADQLVQKPVDVCVICESFDRFTQAASA